MNKCNHGRQQALAMKEEAPAAQAFTFGESEPVLNYGAIMECLECVSNEGLIRSTASA